jgi:hypothetical protein
MLTQDQYAIMAEKAKLPKFGRLYPSGLRTLLRQAKDQDSTPLMVQALLKYASSSGGLTDIDKDLFAWLQEKAKTG